MIVQKVREAERDRQYQEYKDRIGDIVNGIVKRVEYGNVVVDLGRGEAIVRRDEMLPRETFRNGDRIRAFIYDVRREPRGPQYSVAHASAIHGQAVRPGGAGNLRRHRRGEGGGPRSGLARQDRGDLDLRSIRSAPASACAGRACKPWSTSRGEKIDIIPWTPDPANFVVNALAPAEVAKVARRGSPAHGGGGARSAALARDRPARPERAARLPAHRLGHRHRHRAGGSEHRQAEFEKRTKLFIESLNVDEVVGQLLASEGFNSVEELAIVDEKEIAGIEGFDEDTARELQARARDYLGQQEAELDAKRQELGVEDALKEIPASPPPCWSSSARTASRRRGSGRLRHRRPVRLERAQGRRGDALSRLPDGSTCRATRPRR